MSKLFKCSKHTISYTVRAGVLGKSTMQESGFVPKAIWRTTFGLFGVGDRSSPNVGPASFAGRLLGRSLCCGCHDLRLGEPSNRSLRGLSRTNMLRRGRVRGIHIEYHHDNSRSKGNEVIMYSSLGKKRAVATYISSHSHLILISNEVYIMTSRADPFPRGRI